MKILAWNCRGLGKPSAVRALRKLITVQCPDMVFLSETKLCESDLNLKSKLCLDILPNYHLVNCAKCNGKRSGGLVMLWKNDVKLSIHNFNTRFIDCYITCTLSGFNWYATGFYGFSIHNEKHKSCDLIDYIANSHTNANWIIFGDFNMILNGNEKRGGNIMDYNLADKFQNTIDSYSLHDIGYNGTKYTWANNQANEHHIQERLDRYLASQTWIINFQNHTNYHLLRYSSDHCPILLDFWANIECRIPKKDKHLPRFEQLWLQDEESNQIVKNVWKYTKGDIDNKLQDTLDQLHRWGKEKYGDIPRKISEIQKELHQLKERIPDTTILMTINNKEYLLDKLMKEEELWWAQRAKVNWLKAGDKNSKFFHFKASQRKRKNTIKFVQDKDGHNWS